ncbi:MAG: maltose ABC transporter substrate-binding protein, partial [Lachnospiraceae bacterium]|nr:maltose ABC transporter substrate-binding protein [Lachnospiraceae bacterium]
MTKRVIAVLLSGLMTMGLLAGCGAKTSTGSVANDTAESEALPSGDVSLRVWGAEEDEELINQIISGFVSEYGSQANFNIVFEAHSESECKDNILGDVLNAPDVFTFADDQLMAFVASGVLKEIENGSEISGRNLQAASDAATINGKIYAYPLTAD